MTDIVDPLVRSRMMGRIRGSDTQPELLVRRYLHGAGLRYLLHDRRLPGRPDVVFPRDKIAVFVHGCFWHQHPCCRFASAPSTRAEFWQSKFAANAARDRSATERLELLGWTVFVIWECQTRDELELDKLLWRILLARSESTSHGKVTCHFERPAAI